MYTYMLFVLHLTVYIIPVVRYVCDSDREVLSGVSPENGTIICNEICDVIAYQEQNILQPADCELLHCCAHVYVSLYMCVCVCVCACTCVCVRGCVHIHVLGHV